MIRLKRSLELLGILVAFGTMSSDEEEGSVLDLLEGQAVALDGFLQVAGRQPPRPPAQVCAQN